MERLQSASTFPFAWHKVGTPYIPDGPSKNAGTATVSPAYRSLPVRSLATAVLLGRDCYSYFRDEELRATVGYPLIKVKYLCP